MYVKTYRDSPIESSTSADMLGKILHAHLKLQELTIMGSDLSSSRYTAPSPMVQLAISVSTEERAEQIFAALGTGGQVVMPITQTFWTSRFGMLRDKCGVCWMICCDQLPS